MNEIAKCPVCQKGEMSLPSPTWAIGCSRCHFRCHAIQFKQIAAAMELAKAKHQRESIRRNVFGDWDEYDENLLQAERRVLEIFK